MLAPGTITDEPSEKWKQGAILKTLMFFKIKYTNFNFISLKGYTRRF